MWLRWLRPVGIVVLGIAAGGLGSVLAMQRTQFAAAPAPPTKVERREPGRNSLELGARLDRMASRLGALESQRAAVEQSAATAREPAAERETERSLDAEERRRQFWEDQRRELAEHESEGIEASWAKPTAEVLAADIAQIPRLSQGRLLSMDCRTTTCLAKISWPSRAVASAEYQELLHNAYRANCARSIVVDDEPSADGTTHANLIFNCEEARIAAHEMGASAKED
jgi:hypothetical protein